MTSSKVNTEFFLLQSTYDHIIRLNEFQFSTRVRIRVNPNKLEY